MSLLKFAARHRRNVRAWLGGDSEYRLRRALCALVPAAHPARDTHFLHCCAPKTGSQHARLLLSDPRLYRHHGHLPYLDSDPPKDLGRGAMWTSLYWTYPRLLGHFRQMPDARAIFVVRDPRDLLVSWHFSNRYSHEDHPSVLARRRRMAGLSEADAIDVTLDDFDGPAFLLGSWAAATDPRARIVKFEDLTGDRTHETWESVFRHFGFSVPDAALDRLLRFYDVANLRAARSEAGVARYRGGRPGDWRKVLTPRHIQQFEARYGALIDAFGYR